jgi:hypothetical protein
MPLQEDGLSKKKVKDLRCSNCNYPGDTVLRGDKTLCLICAESMPGIYHIGAAGALGLAGVTMRQSAYCFNLILTEMRKLTGGIYVQELPVVQTKRRGRVEAPRTIRVSKKLPTAKS